MVDPNSVIALGLPIWGRYEGGVYWREFKRLEDVQMGLIHELM